MCSAQWQKASTTNAAIALAASRVTISLDAKLITGNEREGAHGGMAAANGEGEGVGVYYANISALTWAQVNEYAGQLRFAWPGLDWHTMSHSFNGTWLIVI